MPYRELRNNPSIQLEGIPTDTDTPQITSNHLHTYPWSDAIYNSFGISDSTRLGEIENSITTITIGRAKHYASSCSLKELCSFETLCGIHNIIFSDLYPCIAGKPRDIDMRRKEFSNSGFSAHQDIPNHAERALRNLGNYLTTQSPSHEMPPLARAKFIGAMAIHYLALYKVHSFREGNTRSVGVLFDSIFERYGFKTTLSCISSQTDQENHKRTLHSAMTYPNDRRFLTPFVTWFNRYIGKEVNGLTVSRSLKNDNFTQWKDFVTQQGYNKVVDRHGLITGSHTEKEQQKRENPPFIEQLNLNLF